MEVPQVGIMFKFIRKMKEYRKGVLMDTTSEVMNVADQEI
jgi:hypothetical protein